MSSPAETCLAAAAVVESHMQRAPSPYGPPLLEVFRSAAHVFAASPGVTPAGLRSHVLALALAVTGDNA